MRFTILGLAPILWTAVSAEPQYPPGIWLDSTTCSASQQATIREALQVAHDQAAAGLAAVQSRETKSLFEFFFRPNDRTVVKNVLQSYLNYVAGQGSSVAFICHDLTNSCPAQGTGAYWVQDTPISQLNGSPPPLSRIFLCPGFFDAVLAPDPCDKSNLELYVKRQDTGRYQTYQSTIMSHEVLHVPYMGGPKLAFMDDYAKEIFSIHQMLDLKANGYNLPPDQVAKAVPRYNADSYTAFATWAWMRNQQQAKCSSNYPLFNILDDGLPSQRNELRKLLGINGDDQSITISFDHRDGVVECFHGCSPPNITCASQRGFKVGDVAFTLVGSANFTEGPPPGSVNASATDGTTTTLAYTPP